LIPRVVFDTNVLISAEIFGGAPAKCLSGATTGHIEAFTCREILEECRRILAEKFGYPAIEADAYVAHLLSFHSLVEISGLVRVVAEDPDDDKVVECVMISGAEFLISGDKHLTRIMSYQNTQIVTPAGFRRALELGL
jgi:putative PIN family toxin of toxin-antitoxin system